MASGASTQQSYDDQRTTLAGAGGSDRSRQSARGSAAMPAREDEVAIAKSSVEAARENWGLAQEQLERCTLFAPLTGRVLQVNADLGEMVGPESIESAVIMADTSRYRVQALVEELDAPRVTEGMTAKVTADGMPGKTFTGHVIRLSPA